MQSGMRGDPAHSSSAWYLVLISLYCSLDKLPFFFPSAIWRYRSDFSLSIVCFSCVWEKWRQRKKINATENHQRHNPPRVKRKTDTSRDACRRDITRRRERSGGSRRLSRISCQISTTPPPPFLLSARARAVGGDPLGLFVLALLELEHINILLEHICQPRILGRRGSFGRVHRRRHENGGVSLISFSVLP